VKNTYGNIDKLKSKKLIEQLFNEGRAVKAFPLRMVFLETPLPFLDIYIQAGVSVSKRNHKLAVTRNRIKRLMREAYRLNKNKIDTKGTTFAVMIIYTSRDVLSFQEINKTTIKLFKRFQDEISSSTI
jgi:ribonuclease P protein component